MTKVSNPNKFANRFTKLMYWIFKRCSTNKTISKIALTTRHMITSFIFFNSHSAFRTLTHCFSLCPFSINVIFRIWTVIPMPLQSALLAKWISTFVAQQFSSGERWVFYYVLTSWLRTKLLIIWYHDLNIQLVLLILLEVYITQYVT
jgi:hypothetical protein